MAVAAARTRRPVEPASAVVRPPLSGVGTGSTLGFAGPLVESVRRGRYLYEHMFDGGLAG
jgi:hypothetical protein